MAERKAIPIPTRLRLFADAAGHCQNPNCLEPLFPEEMGGNKHIAEMAHVIPHADTGPRHEERKQEDYDVDAYKNLILLCVKAYQHREEIREAVTARMSENKAIWEKLAPTDGEKFTCDPESETAEVWSKRMRSVILPNHYRIIAIIKANLMHASEDEKATFAEYQEHVRGLSARHLCEVNETAARYPNMMDGIFE